MTAPEPLGPEDALYALLPAIHRLRDGEAGEPLRALLAAIGREYRVVAEDIDQLLDDQFIETCAPWAVPFIGDLIGYQPLAQPPGRRRPRPRGSRQLVALRRAKGTVSAIEAAARAATGWSARAAEPFRTLARTEYMNLPRHTGPATADLRDEAALDEAGGAFDALPRTVDVRRVESRRGRHNLDQVAVFLWPLRAFALTASPAVPAAPGDPRRFRFDPLAPTARSGAARSPSATSPSSPGP
jgi:hypothetical protein